MYPSQQVGDGNAELLRPMSADKVACCVQAPTTAVGAMALLLRHLSQVGLLLVNCMQAARNGCWAAASLTSAAVCQKRLCAHNPDPVCPTDPEQDEDPPKKQPWLSINKEDVTTIAIALLGSYLIRMWAPGS